jgi:hypothetical protein
MICWNCKTDIPHDAKACVHCEAPVQAAPTKEEQTAARESFSKLDDTLKTDVISAFKKSATTEDFINHLMVGPCPKCESEETSDCETDESIANICVGRCYDCGQYWCLECGKSLEKGRTFCDCMDEPEEGD